MQNKMPFIIKMGPSDMVFIKPGFDLFHEVIQAAGLHYESSCPGD
jgi:hypothetical protein